MISAKHRLKDKKEFDDLFRCGRMVSNEVLLMRYRKIAGERIQIGFSAGVKFSKKSSKRNKVKRWMREAARVLLGNIKGGYQIMFLINSKFPYEQMDYSVVKEKEEDLLKKAGLIK